MFLRFIMNVMLSSEALDSTQELSWLDFVYFLTFSCEDFSLRRDRWCDEFAFVQILWNLVKALKNQKLIISFLITRRRWDIGLFAKNRARKSILWKKMFSSRNSVKLKVETSNAHCSYRRHRREKINDEKEISRKCLISHSSSIIHHFSLIKSKNIALKFCK